ncbi:L-2,4-diaminobutyrate decarboxylase [Roseovarius albus]|uniref:L-2,4-diaminobutyrate decarboxylase n=1 Tax=Roseovarius albus TaxID=1247867 RepID=A0A1X6YB48_9RHOB|nr:pyridoxal-dependent decarboxylase [Roseovarius albus]SLN14193.1 L-2,4-diaminobutyrate decarboxylase [Roseovarius albus]
MKHSLPSPISDIPFDKVAAYAATYRSGKTNLHATATLEELRASFGGVLPEQGQPAEQIIDDLIRAAEPGLVGNTQSGFYAWVMGSSHPAGVAADWLTSIWGQNCGIYQCSPAGSTAEEAACNWVLDLLDLPRQSSVGLTIGATMAGFIGLAAARDEVLRRAGHDIAEDGLQSAPHVTIFISDDTHASNLAALRYLGFGNRNIARIATDDQGCMLTDDLAEQMNQTQGPKIIVGTAGHINTGAFEDFHTMADLSEEHDAWLHIDGAFGLWARSSSTRHALADGVERADSWSTDGHKWLHIPFDAGFAIVKDRAAHRRAMDITASYLPDPPGDGRNATHFNPELSRRARGFTAWATLRAFGKQGVRDLIDNHCHCAELLAQSLADEPGITIHNDVVLNQLILSFDLGRGDEDADQMTQRMEQALNADGSHFFRIAKWQERCVLRVSILSLKTKPHHVLELSEKMKRLWREIRG